MSESTADSAEFARLVESLSRYAEHWYGWEPETTARVLSDARFRSYPVDIVRRAAHMCWADIETESPGRLSLPGWWWSRAHVKPPSAAKATPITAEQAEVNRRGVQFAREQLAAALRDKAQDSNEGKNT